MELLKDKIAVITGGTRGIGLAAARVFLQNGAKTAILGSRKETVEQAMNQLRQEMPDCPVQGYWPDLTCREQVRQTMEQVAGQWGRVDILVNNAGISQRTPLYDYQPGEFEKIMALNVNAVFLCSQAAAEIMRRQGGGVILNASSMVSLYGQPAGVGYPTSKFAVNGITRSLARELGRDNIRVNAVAPGVIATDMVAALPQETTERLAASIPLKRMGKPEDIANAFLFLASDLVSYVSGAVLSVDGAAMV